MNNTTNILVLEGLTLGQKVKLTRLAKGMRQVDLAALAKVQPGEVLALEKDRWIPLHRKIAILKALGFEDEVKALLPPGKGRRLRR